MSHGEGRVQEAESRGRKEEMKRDRIGFEKAHTLLGRSMNRSAIKRPLRQSQTRCLDRLWTDSRLVFG